MSGGGSDVIGARCPDIICVSRYIGPGLGKDLSLQPLWRPALSQKAVSTLHSSLLLLVSPYSANNMAKQTSSTNAARMYVILNKWTLFKKKSLGRCWQRDISKLRLNLFHADDFTMVSKNIQPIEGVQFSLEAASEQLGWKSNNEMTKYAYENEKGSWWSQRIHHQVKEQRLLESR